jgi:hypothetical protein
MTRSGQDRLYSIIGPRAKQCIGDRTYVTNHSHNNDLQSIIQITKDRVTRTTLKVGVSPDAPEG